MHARSGRSICCAAAVGRSARPTVWVFRIRLEPGLFCIESGPTLDWIHGIRPRKTGQTTQIKPSHPPRFPTTTPLLCRVFMYVHIGSFICEVAVILVTLVKLSNDVLQPAVAGKAALSHGELRYASVAIPYKYGLEPCTPCFDGANAPSPARPRASSPAYPQCCGTPRSSTELESSSGGVPCRRCVSVQCGRRCLQELYRTHNGVVCGDAHDIHVHDARDETRGGPCGACCARCERALLQRVCKAHTHQRHGGGHRCSDGGHHHCEQRRATPSCRSTKPGGG